MGTPTTRRRHSRTGLRYETDLTEAERAVIEPPMPKPAPYGRSAPWSMREVLNAFFLCAARWHRAAASSKDLPLPNDVPLPKDLPPRSTAFGSFARWRDMDLFVWINHPPVMAGRERVGREASPSAAVLDSQSIKTVESGGPRATTPARR